MKYSPDDATCFSARRETCELLRSILVYINFTHILMMLYDLTVKIWHYSNRSFILFLVRNEALVAHLLYIWLTYLPVEHGFIPEMTYKVSSGTLSLYTLTLSAAWITDRLRLLLPIQLCPVLLSPSSSSCTRNPLSTFPFPDLFSRCSWIVLSSVALWRQLQLGNCSCYRKVGEWASGTVLHVFRPRRMQKMRTTAIHESVEWTFVSQSICHAGDCLYSFARRRQFDEAITALL